jgi:hypothetical protein
MTVGMPARSKAALDLHLDELRPVEHRHVCPGVTVFVVRARLLGRRRTRPLRLKDIRQDLMDERRLDFEAVSRELGQIEALPPLHERVVSCILGLAQ